MRHSIRTGAPFLAAAALVLALVGASAVAALADDTTDDPTGGGVPIVVTVRSSVPTPAPGAKTPTPTPSPSRSSTGSSGGGSVPGDSSTTAPPADGDLETLPFDELSVGGVLYVSGLSTRYVPSPDPSEGEIRTSFTVRNVSETTIDSVASFSLTNLFGQQLSSVGSVLVLRLEPHETRVVEATLTRPAQWTFVTATYELTPTSLVDDTRVPSVTRDVTVFFVPWLVVVILFASIIVVVILRVRRQQRLFAELPA